MSGDRVEMWVVMLGLAVIAAYSFWIAIKAWSKNRILEETPTSRIRSAAQGYVELGGRAVLPPQAATRGPLTGIPCAWWRYKVEERRATGRSRSWCTIQGATSDSTFLLDDGTGQCLVDPRGAEVFPTDSDVWYGPTEWPQVRVPKGTGVFGWLVDACVTDKYRYTEHRLQPGEHVCALGAFRSVGGAGVGDSDGEVADLLHEWKRDQAALLARFDKDHDGSLNGEEWEKARAAAREQVLAQRAAAPVPPAVDVLSDPADGRAFLLSASDGESLAQRFRRRALAGVGGFVGSSAALAWILTHVGT